MYVLHTAPCNIGPFQAANVPFCIVLDVTRAPCRDADPRTDSGWKSWKRSRDAGDMNDRLGRDGCRIKRPREEALHVSRRIVGWR
jgi:hypothetical protein